MGKIFISAESVRTSWNIEFVLGNVVGIDEDVVQYMMTMIDHIHEDVIHKSLKSGG